MVRHNPALSNRYKYNKNVEVLHEVYTNHHVFILVQTYYIFRSLQLFLQKYFTAVVYNNRFEDDDGEDMFRS